MALFKPLLQKIDTPQDPNQDDPNQGGDAKPTMNNTKEQITDYLTKHNIEFNPDDKKENLLALIK